MNKLKGLNPDNLAFYGLGLFAFSVIFSVSIVQGAMFLVLAAILAKKYKEDSPSSLGRELYANPLFFPWLFYLAVCLLTAALAIYPKKGFSQLNSDFLKYVCFSTLFLSLKKERLPALSRFYAAAAAISGLIGSAQVAGTLINTGNIVRANAFMNAVRYGEVMVIAFTLILARVLSPLAQDSKKERFFYAAAAVPVFISIILSQTRGAYLGLATATGCMFIFGGGLRLKVLALAGIMAAAGTFAVFFNPAINQRLAAVSQTTGTGATEYTGINTRLELWKLGLKIFKAHPVFGIGPDNVKPVFKTFHPGPIGERETWGSLHNLYIHQAAERGIAGLSGLLYLFTAMLLFAWNRFRAVRSPFTLWALCALPAYYVMNFTEISFQHVHTSFAIFFALAFSAATAKGGMRDEG